MRKRTRSASGTARSRSAMPFWIATAQATAWTALAELAQGAVAHELDDAPAVLGDERLDELPAVGLEAAEGALLVALHQARIADHVRGEDGGEPAVDAGSRQGAIPRAVFNGPMILEIGGRDHLPLVEVLWRWKRRRRGWGS